MKRKEDNQSPTSDSQEKNSSGVFPLNTPQSIGKFMTENSPGDRTLLPMAFSLCGCFSTGISFFGEKVAELFEPADENLSSSCKNQ